MIQKQNLILSKFFITLALTFFASHLIAKPTPEYGNWLAFIGNKKFGKTNRFDLHHEFQYRSHDLLGDTQALLLRAGIGYNITPTNNNLLLGVAYVNGFPYIANSDKKKNTNENRIYQQYLHKHFYKRLSLQNRFRLEERWIDNVFNLRFRYLLFLRISLNNIELIENTFYLAFSNEIFLNALKDLFDRNRLFGGIGYQFKGPIRIEVGLLNEETLKNTKNQLNFTLFANY